MRVPSLFVVTAGCIAIGVFGCTSDAPTGPYDPLPLARDLSFPELSGTVHVARDRYGIAHITAESFFDLGFAQGYVLGNDRLQQMDILRRVGAGELAELYGSFEPRLIEADLEMRFHRHKATARSAWQQLKASREDEDIELVALLQGFSAGVNAYASDLQAGTYSVDPALQLAFNPDAFRPWTPVDSLVLGRFQAYALSYTANEEIELTELYQRSVETFDNAAPPGHAEHHVERFRRRGASQDLVRLSPIARVPTVQLPGQLAHISSAATPRPGSPTIPDSLLSNARHFFRRKLPLGPHAFTSPLAGSNSWAVAPALGGGRAFLAGDQHLTLPNPTILYPTHLTIPGRIDIEGVTFPGIPGVVLGHNGRLAWSTTVVNHDVNDVYLERVVPCPAPSGKCVRFQDKDVAIETWQEEVAVGFRGEVDEVVSATYERVPHHGPIIPTVRDGQIIPTTGNEALSVRYTGYSPSHEIRAFFGLWHADTVEKGFAALRHFKFGGQNFVLADTRGNIGWSTAAQVPGRPSEARTWHPTKARDGNAPFFILPGDGSAEWGSDIPIAALPQVLNPPSGRIVTANSDPWGSTFDGNPLNESLEHDVPYVGALYAVGFRTERITERIDESPSHSVATMAAIQNDTRSPMGGRLRNFLVETRPGDSHANLAVQSWFSALPMARKARLLAAIETLAQWSLETPAGTGLVDPQTAIDSRATTIFNVWVHFVLERAFGDEFRAIGKSVYGVNSQLTSRTLVAALSAPESLATGFAPETKQALLCDNMETKETESCDLVALQALDEALQWLTSSAGFGTADPSSWRWGRLHTLTFRPFIPDPELHVPPADDPNPDWRNGYPTAGDQFTVAAANGGYNDRDFTHASGAAQRFIAEIPTGGQITAHMALPGGTVFSAFSPHYRDLADEFYVQGKHFPLPYQVQDVIERGEERWRLSSSPSSVSGN